MKLDWLKPVAVDPGPHVAVYADVSRNNETGAHEIDLRWRDARDELSAQGAPSAALEALDEVAGEPVEVGGRVGRALVASAQGVELDVLLPDPPLRDEATTGRVAHLMPLVRSLADDVRYVLVELDRAGADITVSRSDSPRGGEKRTVEGGHDVLHKIPGGGWSALRYQRRVEDSWDANAGAVADALADLVRTEHPEVVLLTGDVKAAAALRDKAAKPVLELLADVPGGSRHAGAKEDAFAAAVAEALEVVRRRRRDALVDEFEQEIGRTRTGQGPDGAGGAGRAVEGMRAVVGALSRGQVRTLLLRDDPTSDLRLWIGDDPTQVATTDEDLRAMGVSDPLEVRADAALLRALAATDAEIELVAERPVMDGGIGAVLRYADPSTAG
ncbi:baeRF2 domain-containing protein [Kineococcus sp. SYSU DK004]|uniref:baeRF2 domain-containing protein n=1 Tax=Kineococcus sp. SYSU DK004 TaxID=3383125 RepID=UPI003D7E674D